MAETNSDKTDPVVARWRGDFGDAYIGRNSNDADVRRALLSWAKVLDWMNGDHPKSCVELGSNIGNQVRALTTLLNIDAHAVEPNAQARRILAESDIIPAKNIYDGVAYDVPLPDGCVEMSYTCGVLIHVNPQHLEDCMRELYRLSTRYICVGEYYAPRLEELDYRGEKGLLFRNDFGGVLWDLFPDLRLVNYEFFWDRATGIDNSTYWLFEKR